MNLIYSSKDNFSVCSLSMLKSVVVWVEEASLCIVKCQFDHGEGGRSCQGRLRKKSRRPVTLVHCHYLKTLLKGSLIV